MANYLVGFRGVVWSGGAFSSDASTAKEAAVEQLARHGPGFPGGKQSIREVCVTALRRGEAVFTTFDVGKLE